LFYKTNQIIFAALVIIFSMTLGGCGTYKKVDIISEFEKPPEGEMDDIKAIAAIQPELLKMRLNLINPKKLRNVHPKSHGCVNATFTVLPDIETKYQVGLFSKPGYKYEDVKIRFSNATGIISPDVDSSKPPRNNSRGMAIQISGVEKVLGQKVLPVPRQKGTQDFLMINQSVFAIKNVKDYLELSRNQIEELQAIQQKKDKKEIKSPVVKFLGTPNSEGTLKSREAQIITTLLFTPLENPLEAQYFSGAAFLLGKKDEKKEVKEQVMKFSAIPCAGLKPQKTPDNPSENYLRQAMKARLLEKDACFDFMIQVPKDTNNLGIEEATFEWIDKKSRLTQSKNLIAAVLGIKEKIEETIDFSGNNKKDVPFVKVAKIRIPVQNFDTPANDKACEDLELSPWHSLEAHQPLGGINRLRNPIYSESAKGRKSE